MHFNLQQNIRHKSHIHGEYLGRGPKGTRRENQGSPTPQHDHTFNCSTTLQRPLKDKRRPPRVTGQDRSLLQHTVDIELSLRQLLPKFRFETLMENVIPHDDVQSHFDDITDQWGSQPIVCDAADGNMVSRPRLWWNTIGNPKYHFDTDTLAAHMAETRTIRQALQPHRSTPTTINPHQRLGDTKHTNTGGHLPLLDDPSTNRRRKTPSTACKCRPSHLGSVASKPQTVPALAIQTTIPHSIQGK